MSKIELCTMAVMSTAHIPFKDDERLCLSISQPLQCLIVRELEPGWLVWLGNLDSYLIKMEEICVRERLSPAFAACLKKAKEAGAEYLWLHVDGPVVAGLETFDW